MIKWVLTALLLLTPSLASAQVVPSGQFTPGHTVRCQNSTCTVVVDGGGSAGSSKNGQGYLTEIGITNTGTPFCINDALTSAVGGYHQFCLGANALGGALISYNAIGGASPLGIGVNINGTTYPFPGAGNGNVIAPVSPFPVAGNLVEWNGTTTVIDSGVPAPVNVRVFGAVCNGSTDDSTAFNTAITTVNTAGGGTVEVPPGKTCAIASTVTIKSNVIIQLNRGTIKWTGASSGPVFNTSGITPTNDYGVLNGIFDLGGALVGDLFALNSGLRQTFRDLNVINGGGTGTVLDITAAITPHNEDGSTNFALGFFENINVTASVGTCLKLTGSGLDGVHPDPNVVTNNTFVGIACRTVNNFGVDFEKWADTNLFYHFFANVAGSGGVGIVFNNASPSTNVGVYADTFYGPGIDTGGTGLNRTGVVVNFSYNDALYDYANFPHAENGSIVNNGIANGNGSCIGAATPCPYDIYVLYIDAGSLFRTWYPGSNFLYGQDEVIAGIHTSNSNTLSLTAVSGLGSTGTAAVVAGSSASVAQIQLSPSGSGIAAAGVFELVFPASNPPTTGGWLCVTGFNNGSAGWPTPATLTTSGVDATHTAVTWVANSALTTGQTYFVNAFCHAH